MLVKDIKTFGGMGYDSNIYLIDNELLIDTGTGRMFSDIKKEMGSVGVRLIVNTHYHFDHTGGNKKFRDWLGAEIAAHYSDKGRLESGSTLAESFGDMPRIVTVDKALKNGSVLRTKNFAFEVIHTPGHSPGSICLYEKKNKILLSGDTLFSDGSGRTDLPDGSSEQMKKSLEKLSQLEIKYLFPGHGPPKIDGIGFLIKSLLAKQKSEKFM